MTGVQFMIYGCLMCAARPPARILWRSHRARTGRTEGQEATKRTTSPSSSFLSASRSIGCVSWTTTLSLSWWCACNFLHVWPTGQHPPRYYSTRVREHGTYAAKGGGDCRRSGDSRACREHGQCLRGVSFERRVAL